MGGTASPSPASVPSRHHVPGSAGTSPADVSLRAIQHSRLVVLLSAGDPFQNARAYAADSDCNIRMGSITTCATQAKPDNQLDDSLPARADDDRDGFIDVVGGERRA